MLEKGNINDSNNFAQYEVPGAFSLFYCILSFFFPTSIQEGIVLTRKVLMKIKSRNT